MRALPLGLFSYLTQQAYALKTNKKQTSQQKAGWVRWYRNPPWLWTPGRGLGLPGSLTAFPESRAYRPGFEAALPQVVLDMQSGDLLCSPPPPHFIYTQVPPQAYWWELLISPIRESQLKTCLFLKTVLIICGNRRRHCSSSVLGTALLLTNVRYIPMDKFIFKPEIDALTKVGPLRHTKRTATQSSQSQSRGSLPGPRSVRVCTAFSPY